MSKIVRQSGTQAAKYSVMSQGTSATWEISRRPRQYQNDIGALDYTPESISVSFHAFGVLFSAHGNRCGIDSDYSLSEVLARTNCRIGF